MPRVQKSSYHMLDMRKIQDAGKTRKTNASNTALEDAGKGPRETEQGAAREPQEIKLKLEEKRVRRLKNN